MERQAEASSGWTWDTKKEAPPPPQADPESKSAAEHAEVSSERVWDAVSEPADELPPPTACVLEQTRTQRGEQPRQRRARDRAVAPSARLARHFQSNQPEEGCQPTRPVVGPVQEGSQPTLANAKPLPPPRDHTNSEGCGQTSVPNLIAKGWPQGVQN